MAYMVTDKTRILHKGKIFYPGSVIQDEIAKEMSIESLEKTGKIAKVKEQNTENPKEKKEPKEKKAKQDVPEFVNEIKSNFKEEFDEGI